MLTKSITIVNKLGLHARAAAKLATLASEFESEIFITRKQRKVNAKSIMGVMMLAAARGMDIDISVSGTDEQAALEALETLINNRFDEAS